MREFQSVFISTCEQIWQEFKGKVNNFITSYVPDKTLRGRKKNTLDHTGDWEEDEYAGPSIKKSREADRQLFKKAKYEVDPMIKISYNIYLNSL